MNNNIDTDQMQNPKLSFDPSKALFNLSLDEAFGLTEVRSLEGYQRLKERLPRIRGSSYFFINILDGVARLMMTVIVADSHTVTTSAVLDHKSLGISYDQLIAAARRFGNPMNGNFPLSREIESRLRKEWQISALDTDKPLA